MSTMAIKIAKVLTNWLSDLFSKPRLVLFSLTL